jgi:hypothetical protein
VRYGLTEDTPDQRDALLPTLVEETGSVHVTGLGFTQLTRVQPTGHGGNDQR